MRDICEVSSGSFCCDVHVYHLSYGIKPSALQTITSFTLLVSYIDNFLTCHLYTYSTVSSGVNALALTFMTDVLRPVYRFFTKSHINEKRATLYSKLIALTYGFLTIGLAFLSEKMGPLILQIALSIFGMVGGPLLGLFVMAMFIPCVNSWVCWIIILWSSFVLNRIVSNGICYHKTSFFAIRARELASSAVWFSHFGSPLVLLYTDQRLHLLSVTLTSLPL